jgi:hypothetical protein
MFKLIVKERMDVDISFPDPLGSIKNYRSLFLCYKMSLLVTSPDNTANGVRDQKDSDCCVKV